MRFSFPFCLAVAAFVCGLFLPPPLGAADEDEKKSELPVKRVVMFSSGVAEGNDPEALLLLEMLKEDGGKEPRWRYTLARMTTYPVVVQLDDREVFKAEPYWDTRRTPEDPYVEARDGPFALPAAEDKPGGKE